jgi:hypothetical protein
MATVATVATVAAKAPGTPGPDLGTTILLFVSSTFADFQLERDLLQRRVFPYMRYGNDSC